MPTLKHPIKVKNKLQGKVQRTASTFELPMDITPALTRPEQAKILLVGPPGWGKTTFALSNPDCLLLAFEEGHSAIAGHKIIIDTWDNSEPWVDDEGIQHSSFVMAVASLQNSKKFKMVFIDTLDAAVRMLLDEGTERKKVEHASDYGEWGKGWDVLQNKPLRIQMQAILKTGRGVICSTHTAEESKNFKNAGTRAKKETSLPRGVYKFIFGNFDLILHGWIGKKVKGQFTRQRILQSEGSSDILAKNRGGFLPPAYIVDPNPSRIWKQFSEFFTDPKKREAAFEKFQETYELE